MAAGRLVFEAGTALPDQPTPTDQEGMDAMTAVPTRDDVAVAALCRDLQASVERVLACGYATHGLRRALRAAVREIDLWDGHVRSAADLGDRAGRLEARQIQIGGGAHTLAGFVNVDLVPPADVLWDVREGLPFRDATSSVIFAEHFLEHIDYPVSARRFVTECFRVLAAGGHLIIGVPDAALVIDGYVNDDRALHDRMMRDWYGNRDNQAHFNTYVDLVNYVFRDQDDSDRYTAHLWAYDYPKLESLLTSAGFRGVEPWQFDPRIANPERQWGSVYAVATK